MKKIYLITICVFFSGCTFPNFQEQEFEKKDLPQETNITEPAQEKKDFICGQDKIKDADGNEYTTAYFDVEGGHDVTKDGQCWMTENLNIGTVILDSDEMPGDDGVIEKWCPNHVAKNMICYMGGGGGPSPEKEAAGCYNKQTLLTNNPEFCNGNPEKNIPPYGGLYTRREIFPKEGDICPEGWTIPSEADWNSLEESVRKSITLQELLDVEAFWGQYAWNVQDKEPIPTGWKLKKPPFNGLPQVKEGELVLSPIFVNFPKRSLEMVSPGNPGYQYELSRNSFTVPVDHRMSYEEFKDSTPPNPGLRNEELWYSQEYTRYKENFTSEQNRAFSVRCIKNKEEEN